MVLQQQSSCSRHAGSSRVTAVAGVQCRTVQGSVEIRKLQPLGPDKVKDKLVTTK